MVRRIAAMLGILGLALLLVALIGLFVMGLAWAEVRSIVLLFGELGLIAGLISIFVIQGRVLNRFKHVRTQIMLIIGLGGLLVAMLLRGIAQAMFISTDHDLPLLLLMLVFMLVLAIGFGMMLANVVTQRIMAIRSGTERLKHGDLVSRLQIAGQDEVAALAQDFNTMADALEQAAQRQQELESARRELVAAVSHDLRTPLTAVRVMVEALADGVVQDEATRQRYHHSIAAQINNLSGLVNDLFEIAQIDAGMLRLEVERASLRDLISDSLSSLQAQAAKQGVQLIGTVDNTADLVLINPPKIQRVLFNLISNALRHTPADGTIMVAASDNGDHIQVAISDSGEGIDPADLPHIFERTYRGEKSRSRDYGGAGLGLAIVQGIIEAHGGKVWVESQPHQGTRFTFTLNKG